MDVTERLSLEAVSEHTLIASEHLHRYEFAAALCDGARVLDLCCGSGYGSAVLARRAASVRGVDNDVATIETAMRTVQSGDPIEFVAADAAAHLRTVEPEQIDTIVCFEGLEHVANLDELADQLARLASRGVRLILSVPNSEMWEEENEFHLTSFSHDTALVLFERLGSVRLLVQNLAEGSLIVDPQEPGRHAAPDLKWAERVEPEYANHFLAVVNVVHELVDDALSGRLEVSYAPTYNRYIRNIERANSELWRTNARLGRDAFSRSGAAAATNSKLEQRGYDGEIARLNTQVRELTEALRIREEILQRYIAEAQRRARRPTRRVAQVVVRTVAGRGRRAS